MKSILLVDDAAIILRNVKQMLDGYYNVSVATTGVQCFAQLGQRKIDLILLDYQMPTMDGKEIFVKLKLNQKYRDIPVIFLTGASDKKTVSEILCLSPDGYLLKPVEKVKLIQTIEAAIAKKG